MSELLLEYQYNKREPLYINFTKNDYVLVFNLNKLVNKPQYKILYVENEGFVKTSLVVENGKNYTDDQIRALTEFQEQYFESEIIRDKENLIFSKNIPELSVFGSVMEIIMYIFMGIQNFQKAMEEMKDNLYSLEA